MFFFFFFSFSLVAWSLVVNGFFFFPFAFLKICQLIWVLFILLHKPGALVRFFVLFPAKFSGLQISSYVCYLLFLICPLIFSLSMLISRLSLHLLFSPAVCPPTHGYPILSARQIHTTYSCIYTPIPTLTADGRRRCDVYITYVFEPFSICPFFFFFSLSHFSLLFVLSGFHVRH